MGKPALIIGLFMTAAGQHSQQFRIIDFLAFGAIVRARLRELSGPYYLKTRVDLRI
jgi:hypothetical protein